LGLFSDKICSLDTSRKKAIVGPNKKSFLGGISMLRSTLPAILALTFLLSGCGNHWDFDEFGNPANFAPGARFKFDFVERSFTARGLTRCQFGGGNNGLGALEMSFQDSESDSEIRLALVGFYPQNNQHQIVGSGNSSGGSILLRAGGDQRLMSFKNQSANGRGNSTQCQFRTRIQGSSVEIAFQCMNLYNDYGQPRNASGELRCRTEQYTWD